MQAMKLESVLGIQPSTLLTAGIKSSLLAIILRGVLSGQTNAIIAVTNHLQYVHIPFKNLTRNILFREPQVTFP